jgi:hypothetical protein
LRPQKPWVGSHENQLFSRESVRPRFFFEHIARFLFIPLNFRQIFPVSPDVTHSCYLSCVSEKLLQRYRRQRPAEGHFRSAQQAGKDLFLVY